MVYTFADIYRLELTARKLRSEMLYNGIKASFEWILDQGNKEPVEQKA